MSTIKYKIPTSAKGVDNLIVTAINSARAMKDNIQIAAVAILHHAYKHGDYTKANELVNGLGHGVKRDSLVEYFVQYGGLGVAEDGSGFDSWKGADYIRGNYKEAKEVMWWDFKKVNPFKGYSFEGEIQKLIKKHVAMTKKLESLSDEDKAKVDLEVSSASIQALLQLTDFEVLSEEDMRLEKDLIDHLEADQAA